MSAAFPNAVPIRLPLTDRGISMLGGKRSDSVPSLVEKISLPFAVLTVPNNSIIVLGSLYDVLVGVPEMPSLLACLELGKQDVSLTRSGRIAKFNYEYDSRHRRRIISDAGWTDFKSGIVCPSSASTDDEESGLVISLREDDRNLSMEYLANEGGFESGAGWEELEDFNIVKHDLDSFRQY